MDPTFDPALFNKGTALIYLNKKKEGIEYLK